VAKTLLAGETAADHPFRATDGRTPSRQEDTGESKDFTFPRGIRPSPPIALAGGGGWPNAQMPDFLTFLAFRQLRVPAEWGLPALEFRVSDLENDACLDAKSRKSL
jgi:hypothetical protein